MRRVAEPSRGRAPIAPAPIPMERVAGWILLGGFAALIPAVLLFLAGSPWKPAVLAFGLVVSLFGLIAFEEALRDRGERLLPRFGTAAFAIGTISFIAHDALGQGTGHYTFELERVYTVLACVAIALFGWSSLRSKALSSAIGWVAIAWAFLDGYLYVSRTFIPPLGPNLALLMFGAALVRTDRSTQPA